MARKSKARPKVKVVSEPDKLISQPDFLSLLRACKNRQKDMDEARGSMGNAVKLAMDKKHLDRAAFAIFRRLDRLSDNKLAVTRRNLLHYLEIGGLNDRASRQLDALEQVEAPKRARKQKPPAAVQLDLSERPDAPLN